MGDAFCGRSMAPSYARIANPTTTYLEERVRQLTGAISVTALNTGMTAIHYALTAVSAAGLNIVASKHLFGNSVSLIRDTLGNFGVEPRFVDFTKPDEVEAQIDDKTCALFFEIITNPQLFVADIRKIADIAHKAGVPLIVPRRRLRRRYRGGVEHEIYLRWWHRSRRTAHRLRTVRLESVTFASPTGTY